MCDPAAYQSLKDAVHVAIVEQHTRAYTYCA